MHDAAADAPAHGRRVRRWLLRLLLVIGGTLTVTAAGWLISTATASASTMPSDDPGTSQSAQDPAQAVRQALTDFSDRAHAAGDELRQAARPLTEPLARTLHGTTEFLRDPQRSLRDAAAGAEHAWHHTTGHLGDTVAGLPLHQQDLAQVVTGADQLTADDAAGAGPLSADDAAGAATAAVTPSPLPGDVATRQASPGTATTAAARQPQPSAGPDAAAGQRPDRGTPGRPSAPLPVDRTPGVVPSGSTGGTVQGGSGAAPGFAALAPAAILSDTMLRLPSLRYVPRSHGTSERQPGITPD